MAVFGAHGWRGGPSVGWRRKVPHQNAPAVVAHQHMRVLRDPTELAQAAERAADGERRLRARLDARAARDAWSAERRARTVETTRFVDTLPGGELPPPLGATSGDGATSHSPPAA